MSGMQMSTLGNFCVPPGIVNGNAFNGASSITLNSDGSVTASASAYNGPPVWYAPTPAGIGASYWARTTKTAGTGLFLPASGTWVSLSAGQAFTISGGAGTPSGVIEFAIDAAGATIVASNSISLSTAV